MHLHLARFELGNGHTRGMPMTLNTLELRSTALAASILLASALLVSDHPSRASAGACDRSTGDAFTACNGTADSEYQYAAGMCANIKEQSDRQTCISQAEQNQSAGQKLCQRQRAARNDV